MPGTNTSRILQSRLGWTLLWIGLVLASVVSRAGTPSLVLDINGQRQAQSSAPTYLGKLGAYSYFIAAPTPGSLQSALYKSDGTDAGTTKVQTINGFGVLTYQQPTLFIPAGTKAYFLAFQTTTGQEVWVTDGTEAGTHMVADLYPGAEGNPRLVGLLGTDLIFAESSSASSWQIYRTDGTSAGTHAITNFADSTYGRLNEGLVINGRIYVAIDSANECCHPDLWVSDGTLGGTAQITGGEQLPWHLQPASLRQLGSSLLFLSTTEEYGTEVTIVDTATNALTYLGTTVPGPGSGAQWNSTIAVMDGFAMYIGNGATTGFELYRTDGAVAGTLVKDIVPGVAGSMRSQDTVVTRVGNHAVFIADDGPNGRELWSSDGTEQGTVPLIADPQSPTSGFVQPLIGVVGTHGYYAIYTGSDWEVVVTDGTVAGTHVLTDIPIDGANVGSTHVAGDDNLTFINAYKFDAATSVVQRLFAYAPQSNTLTHIRDTQSVIGIDPPLFDNGHLLFQSYDPVTGAEPWISDGTVAGTHMLQNVAPEAITNDSNPSSFVDFGGRLAFVADDGVTGAEPWISDGTAAGTKQLADVNPGSAASFPSHLTVMSGALYFFANDQSLTSHLMKITSVGATPGVLADLVPIPPGSQYYVPPCSQDRTAVMNGSLYFVAQQTGSSGYELWKTDGTAGGTVALTSLSAANLTSVPCSLTTVGNRVYFTTTTVASGNELWVTDGTSAGTVQVADLVPGAGSSNPTLSPTAAVLNGQYYFSAGYDGQLWKTDGTASGTVVVLSYASLTGGVSSYGWPVGVLNGKLLIEVSIPSTASEQLWVSDGTAGGFTQLNTPYINSGTSATVIGTKAYFAAQDSATGYQPWVTDGTQAGTFMLTDTDPQQTSTPLWYRDFHGVTVFEVTGGPPGYQLWQTDGTSAGTKSIGSIGMPPSGPYPTIRPQLVVGQSLFFASAGVGTGIELFALANNAPVAVADSASSTSDSAVTINVLANDSDSDGSIDPASVQITTNPGHGTATVGTGGSIVYTPTAGYAGTDTFAYTAADRQGAVSAPAQVTVTVSAGVTVVGTGGSGDSGGGKGGGGAIGLMDMAALLALIGFQWSAGRLRGRHARPSTPISGLGKSPGCGVGSC